MRISNPNTDDIVNKSFITDATAAQFESEVLRSLQPVLVAFWAPWSHPCQILISALEEAALECAEIVKIVKINADDNPDLSIWYEIQSIPTLLFFVGGTLRGKLVGTASKQAILSKLHSALHPGDSTRVVPAPEEHP
jgi:thioredoxin 1